MAPTLETEVYKTMRVAAIIARIILGVAFTAVGIGTFFIKSPQPLPGLAGEFNEAFFRSHWLMFVSAAQALLGIALLTNRYVPLALVVLAAFTYNSFAFHITMMPSGLFAPIVVTVLWFLVAWAHRETLAPLLVARPATGLHSSNVER